jgi:hypothetical protein
MATRSLHGRLGEIASLTTDPRLQNTCDVCMVCASRVLEHTGMRSGVEFAYANRREIRESRVPPTARNNFLPAHACNHFGADTVRDTHYYQLYEHFVFG